MLSPRSGDAYLSVPADSMAIGKQRSHPATWATSRPWSPKFPSWVYCCQTNQQGAKRRTGIQTSKHLQKPSSKANDGRLHGSHQGRTCGKAVLSSKWYQVLRQEAGTKQPFGAARGGVRVPVLPSRCVPKWRSSRCSKMRSRSSTESLSCLKLPRAKLGDRRPTFPASSQ